MPTITAIELLPRSRRYRVTVDGAFAIALSEKTVVDLSLRIGGVFDGVRLAEAVRAEDGQKALAASVRLLESRQRSKKEIEDRLIQRGFGTATVIDVADKLTNCGLIDDVAFADGWVESRNRTQPSGARRLKSELLQKGIDRGIIDGALGGVTGDGELALARRALSKRTNPLPTDPTERRAEYGRQAGYLSRRGFDWETVERALRERFGNDPLDE
jgi:regulatory protein